MSFSLLQPHSYRRQREDSSPERQKVEVQCEIKTKQDLIGELGASLGDGLHGGGHVVVALRLLGKLCPLNQLILLSHGGGFLRFADLKINFNSRVR